jgi:hypothetical protein
LYPNQVFAVDYESQDDLRFALRGIDLVISTVSGNPQINLIDAAAHSEVRRFVPAEFEGQPRRRPRNDPVDRGRAACLERLRHWSASNRHQMDYTVFTCGVFYERFARGGLGSLGIGASSNVYYPGSYLMNVEAGTAEIVEISAGGHPVRLVLTSITDVARFLVAALEIDLNTWPEEFRMQGDRRTVTEIVQWAGMIKGCELLDPLSSKYADRSQSNYPRRSFKPKTYALISNMRHTIKTLKRLPVSMNSWQPNNVVTTSAKRTLTRLSTLSRHHFGIG